MPKQRVTWKAKVLPGKLEEYIKRHDDMWPEMTAVLKEAGISNYTIWSSGDELFGYYECDDIKKAANVQAKSVVVDRWNEYMREVMVMEFDSKTGIPVILQQVFFLE